MTSHHERLLPHGGVTARVLQWRIVLQVSTVVFVMAACPLADRSEKKLAAPVLPPPASQGAVDHPAGVAQMPDAGARAASVATETRRKLYCDKKEFYIEYLRDNPNASNAGRIRQILEGEDMRDCP